METELTRLREKIRATNGQDRPDTIAGTIRWLWPEISACLSTCKLPQIRRVLASAGAELAYYTRGREIRPLRAEESRTLLAR